MKTQKELDAAAEACHKNCSDYSCVRAGYCTGIAGGRADEHRRAHKQRLEQDREDRALANQIRRLKKAGLI